MVKCNLHTHTLFCDGEHSAEEIVLEAIDEGLTAIGFSAHAPSGVAGDIGCLTAEVLPAYRNEILRLKSIYRDKITVLLGMEQDYFSPQLDGRYDYVIGSVHYIKRNGDFVPVDISYEELKQGIDRLFGGDAMSMAKEYYRTVADVVNKTGCDIVGHLDLLTKFNEEFEYLDESDPKYRSMALEAADALLETNAFIEVNTGAMRKGRRSQPYPAAFIIKHIAKKNGRLILSSDAHSKHMLRFGFYEAEECLKDLGVKELWVYDGDGFKSLPL